jgi:hypothetical protein
MRFIAIIYVREHDIHSMGIPRLSTPQASAGASDVSTLGSDERLDSGERSEHTSVQNQSYPFP